MRHAAAAVVMIALLCGRASAQDTRAIVTEGVVGAPLEVVWAAWTTSEGLRSWLAPHADIDLRLGGLMRVNYSAAGSLEDSRAIHNVILSFEPQQMLSIKVAKTPEGFPFPTAIQQMWTVIYLAPVEPGSTRVRVVSLGFGPDDEAQRMRAFFERGNATTVKQLQQHFSTGPQ